MRTRDSATDGARRAPGRTRPHIVALAAAVALPLAAAPLAAQRTTEAARACDSCDMDDSLAAVQREYEKVRADYQRIASKAMRQRMEEMRARMEASRSALRAGEGVFARVPMRVPMLSSAPAGWLGLTFSGSYTVRQKDGEKGVMRFEDYPTVEAVDPGSPAEKAGIEAGDKLLSLDGHDLREGSPSFSELLRPGAKLDAKLKRGHRTRNVTITVGKRPRNYAANWGDWGMFTAPDRAPELPEAPDADWPDAASAPAPPLPPTLTVRAMPSLRALAPATEAWSMSFSGVPTIVTGFSSGIIAGAQVQRVKELSDYFGVDDGLLVLHVVPGTPAERAGLRPGDVIRRAGDRTITTPVSLQRALAASDSGELELDIVRKGKSRSVELKWDN